MQTIIWAALCGVALGVALWRPHVARIGIGVFFILMAIGVNGVLTFIAPDEFVRLGTDAPLLPVYEWAFAHVVAQAPVVLGLLMAAFEVTAGVLMIMGGRPGIWGLGGGLVFLIVSVPLGPWTLPNLILAAAVAIALRHALRVRASGAPDRLRVNTG